MKDFEYQCRNIPSIVTSEIDKRLLDGYSNVKVIPNGVDLEKFQYKTGQKKDIDVLFVGNMGYYPNAQAAEYLIEKIFPLLKKEGKDIKIFIVGPNPNKKIKSFSDEKNIFVTGFVEDVREYYYRAKVAVVPMLSGSGIQNKILEAMASGTPVITTSIGNLGIGALNPGEIIIADEPDAFAEMIRTLLEDKEMRRELAFNGRSFVERSFSWEKRSQKLESFYKQVLSNFKL